MSRLRAGQLHVTMGDRFLTWAQFHQCIYSTSLPLMCRFNIALDMIQDFFLTYFLLRSLPQKLWKCDLSKTTTNGDPTGSRTGDLSAQSPRLYHCALSNHTTKKLDENGLCRFVDAC